MGQITIEIPQRVKRVYRIVSEDSADEVLARLDDLVKTENRIGDDEILGLWADRIESVEEIAQGLRAGSNSRSRKNG